MKPSSEQLELYFKNFCDYLGLNSGEIRVIHAAMEPTIYINYGVKVDYQDLHLSENPRDFFDRVFKPIVDSISNSEAVKDNTYKLEKELKDTVTELALANTEIDRLKEFETYYNMHFKMTHGKE